MDYKTNSHIQVARMRVIGVDGTNLGVMSRIDALRTAREQGLDLVQVTTSANPPICRILDYGKFKTNNTRRRVLSPRRTVLPPPEPPDIALAGARLPAPKNPPMSGGAKVMVDSMLREGDLSCGGG